MKRVEFADEVVLIAVSVSRSLECSDLIVDAFKGPA